MATTTADLKWGGLIASVPKLERTNFKEWKFVVSMVLRHEGQRRGGVEEIAGYTANAAYTRTKKGAHGPPVCYACGRTGHIQRDCRYLKKARKLAKEDASSDSSDSEAEDQKKHSTRKREASEHAAQVRSRLPDLAY
jgi:Zinc knuckle